MENKNVGSYEVIVSDNPVSNFLTVVNLLGFG